MLVSRNTLTLYLPKVRFNSLFFDGWFDLSPTDFGRIDFFLCVVSPLQTASILGATIHG